MTSSSAKLNQMIWSPGAIPRVEEALECIYGGLDRVRPPATLVGGAVSLQGCLPLLMEETSPEGLMQRVGQKKYEQLRNLYRQSSLLNLRYNLELNHVLETITAAGIGVMLLKGAEIATTLYPRPELRHFNDIDLMVHPEDLGAAIAILERQGYRYHQEYRFESISRRRSAFVYVKEGIDGHLVFEIHTSPHRNEMGISFDTAQIWERARSITVAGNSIFGMGLEDLLLYLCWHYRSHSFSRLIWLYDIAIAMLRCAEQLDWALVHRLAYERGLAATVYYCLRLCEQVFHVSIPEKAHIEKYMPPIFIQRLIARQISDDLPSVLRRSAYRKRKLLQRLMVDNVRTLCLVMVRAVFPGPTHLGRLYMEHSRLPLHLFWLYYPLHPLLVLRAYFKNRRGKRSSHR
jgi:hypothetical protein